MLYSDHPNSPDQAYYLTEKGMKVYNAHKDDKIVDGPAEWYKCNTSMIQAEYKL